MIHLEGIEKCCAFTGPRPKNLPWKNDETDSRCVKLKAVLDEQIAALASSGVIHYLSGMAEAVDYEKRRIMRSEASKLLYIKIRYRNHFA